MPPKRRQPRSPTPGGSTDGNGEADANPLQLFVKLLVGALMNQTPTHAPSFKDFKAIGPPKF